MGSEERKVARQTITDNRHAAVGNGYLSVPLFESLLDDQLTDCG